MRRTLVTAVATAFVAALVLMGSVKTAQATEVGYNRKLGLGIVFGDPTGLSGKYWIGPTNSIDFGVGFWGYGFNECWHDSAGNHCDGFGYDSGSINADYLWQSNLVRGTVQLDWHIGAGGRLIWFGGCNGDCAWIGARMPVGLDLMFQNPSFLEIFVEIAPALYVLPPLRPEIEAALGVRAYF